ncbi:hypothetical protein AA098_10265 [Pseudomonas sp. JY-Q]|uniref:hypothetical protein n=1 Tax=Pseudomonas sp. JY-Q TaxID=1338689 RepID=UPI0007DE1F84|nr:hypothetical protein [Pseudomonas sp. JY-Q]ANI33842.1 hypothetical protein AA098_10265 [Pseudomonas sp. JY-Q]
MSIYQMTDGQLLKLAADAFDDANLFESSIGAGWTYWIGFCEQLQCDVTRIWDPLQDDGDALRLVVKLRLQVVMNVDWVEVLQDGIVMANAASVYFAGCMFATARAAIVRAAAESQRRQNEERACDHCRGEGRVGGPAPDEGGGKNCGSCGGTGLYSEVQP